MSAVVEAKVGRRARGKRTDPSARKHVGDPDAEAAVGAPIDYDEVASLGACLVVGDGDYAFALAAARSAGGSAGWLTATAYDAAPVDAAAAARCAALAARGARVRHGVDATAIFDDGVRYASVLFNFPYAVRAERRPQIHDNRALLVDFFKSAEAVLAKSGRVYVALARGQGGTRFEETARTRFDAYGNSWKVVEAASASGLVLERAGPPRFPPGYAGGGYGITAENPAGGAIGDAYANGAIAHVFARAAEASASICAIDHAHDLSFWLPSPDGHDDAGFAATAAAVAGRFGAALKGAALADAYACTKTGRTARTYRVVVATGARAVSRAASAAVCAALCAAASETHGYESRSYGKVT